MLIVSRARGRCVVLLASVGRTAGCILAFPSFLLCEPGAHFSHPLAVWASR